MSVLTVRDWILLGLGLVVSWWMKTILSQPLVVNTRDAPLVVIEDDYLKSTSVRECALRPLHQNPLSHAFAGTRGRKATFFDVKALSSSFKCFAPFIDAVRDPRANGWVLNVLSCRASLEDPVQWHIDQTLRVPWDLYAGRRPATSVDVFYASVPQNMSGGNLDLRLFHPSFLQRYGMKSMKVFNRLDDPSAVLLNATQIQPRTYRRVSFRGDAHHRVTAFSLLPEKAGSRRESSSSDDDEECRRGGDADDDSTKNHRISVVLEQYSLPLPFLARWGLLTPLFIEDESY